MSAGWPGGRGSVRLVVDFGGYSRLAAAEVPRDGLLLAEWAAESDWPRLFPGAASGPDAAWWHERLEDPEDGLDLLHLRGIAYALAEQVYAVPFWAARRLARSARANWFGFCSWCAAAGLDPTGLPVDVLLAAVWAWRSEWLDVGTTEASARAARRRLHTEIFDAPAGAAPAAEVHEAKLAVNRSVLAQLAGAGVTGLPGLSDAEPETTPIG